MIPLADSRNFLFLFKLALKHRQGKNHKMRIIAFVGSPVEDNEKDVSPSDNWGIWAPHVWEWGLLAPRRAREALGSSLWGKEDVQNSVFLLGGPWRGLPIPVCFCEVCHLPSWYGIDFLISLPFFPAGETG